MGQTDILEHLIKARVKSDEFHDIPSIAKAIGTSTAYIYRQINQLDRIMKCFDNDIPKDQSRYSFRRKIRIKEKYLNLSPSAEIEG